MRINKSYRKLKKNKSFNKDKNRNKNNIYLFKLSFIFLLSLCILLLSSKKIFHIKNKIQPLKSILINKENNTFLNQSIQLNKDNNIVSNINTTNIELNSTSINKTNKFQYYCCFCGMGKKENLYSRELISYYINLGVEKFVFGDNNLPNTEKLSDVLQDYISNGTVDILEIYGSAIGQGEFYGVMYEKYKEKCEWLTFFDFDEYLVMEFEEGKYLKLKEYLSNPMFDNCEAIVFNWLMYGDNDLVYYDNRSSIERFTKPDYSNYANKFVKTIVRGNLTKKVFIPGRTHHRPSPEINLCNSMGKQPENYPDCVEPPVHKYAYIMHFNTKTADEYADKIRRGYPGNHFENEDERVNLFFRHNKFTEEKLKVFEKKLNRSFDNYHHKYLLFI